MEESYWGAGLRPGDHVVAKKRGRNKAAESLEDNKYLSTQPPAGSKPIDETPWSGDHGEIKGAIGAGPTDTVKISPNGEVWVQNPDGSWTNHGDVGNLTGSAKASGEKGKERDRKREEQRSRGREKRRWSDRERM